MGPLALEVLKPMQSLQITLDDNDSALARNLSFDGLSSCVEEDRQVLRQGRFVSMDVTRFTQFGRWRGTLRMAGETIDLASLKVHDIRDRSWGRCNVGEPDAGAPANPPQGLFLWAPILWPDQTTLAVFFEDSNGQPIHAEGKSVPLYDAPDQVPGVIDPAIKVMSGASRQVRYVPGTRRAESTRIGLLDIGGARREITLEPLLRHQMKGTGYHHPRWEHGTWQGELATGHESWRLADIDPLAIPNLHIQQLVRAVLDWEMAPAGDPLGDLAWGINRAWSFLPGMAGGLVPRAVGLEHWEHSSGLHAGAEALHGWELFSYVKGQAIWQTAGRAIQSGANQHLIMAFAAWSMANTQDRVSLEWMGRL